MNNHRSASVSLAEVYNGKTLQRILLNSKIAAHSSAVTGKVLDLAGGKNASYFRFLPTNIEVVSVNTADRSDIAERVDFNKRLPYEDGSFDCVLLLNAIYIAENPLLTLSEAGRVLKKGGSILVNCPLVQHGLAEPHDYTRFTAEGLAKELTLAGFSSIKIEKVGERFAAIANLLHAFLYFNTIRYIVYTAALWLDEHGPQRLKASHPAPIDNLAIARKV